MNLKKNILVRIKCNLVTRKREFLIFTILFVFLFLILLVFCLCEHKNYETYELIIRVLKIAVGNLKLDLKPIYWMSDYESGLTKAIKTEVNFLFNKFFRKLSLLNLH